MAFIKKTAALLFTIAYTIATIALLFVTFDRGGRWFILLIVWMPIYWIVCTMLGFPVKRGEGPAADPSDHL